MMGFGLAVIVILLGGPLLSGCPRSPNAKPEGAPASQTTQEEPPRQSTVTEFSTEQTAVAEVVRLFQEMPVWILVAREDEEQINRIMAILEKIRAYPLDTIRLAMQDFEKHSQTTGDDDKLYLVNKYLFDLPEKFPREEARFFRGYVIDIFSLDKPSESVNLMWPFSWGPDGMPRLTGFPVLLLGPPYDALGAFDYYREKFGPRRFPSSSGEQADDSKAEQKLPDAGPIPQRDR
jgi:hypothetical protein